MVLLDAAKSAFPWTGIVLVLVYGGLVRYWARPFLAARWAYFKERQSAPYFFAFIVLVLACGVQLAFGQEPAAESLSPLAYFFLVAGVIVELVGRLRQDD